MADRDYTHVRLDRKPSPPDDRDYRLADYLHPIGATPPADPSYADKTIRQISAEGASWALLLRIWALIKELANQPSPPSPPSPPPLGGTVVWQDAEQLDQDAGGDTGHCVGFGIAQWGNTLPFDDHYTNDQAHALYYQVKGIELGHPVGPFNPPGSGPANVEDGANVRDGMKALQSNGRLNSYARAHDTATEVTPWIQQHGTIVVGTEWLAGMDNFDPNTGLLRAIGQSRGGHCWAISGYIKAGDSTPDNSTFPFDVYRMQNSWGRGWNQQGFGYLSVTDMQTLLDADGEAWAAVELPV